MNKTSVAYLGPAYTYSHLAAQMVQPDESLLLPCDTIDQVFSMIESHGARCGLVPLFNTSSGLVTDTLFAILRRLVGHSGNTISQDRTTPGADSAGVTSSSTRPTTQLCISASLVVPIQHCLVSWGTRSEIRVVLSKQQALDQCHRWLEKNFPLAERVPTESSSAALQDMQQHPEQAAIVSRTAALSLAAPLCLESIQDHPDNATEFVLVQLDAENKPVLEWTPADQANRPTRQYLVTQFANKSPRSTSGIRNESNTNLGNLNSWNAWLQFGAAWYEAQKGPLENPPAHASPWTGEFPSSVGLDASQQTGPIRSWRLGLSRTATIGCE